MDNNGEPTKKYIVLNIFFNNHEEEIRLIVILLVLSNLFFEHDWLKKHNNLNID